MAKAVCDRCGVERRKDSNLQICDDCDAILEREYGLRPDAHQEIQKRAIARRKRGMGRDRA